LLNQQFKEKLTQNKNTREQKRLSKGEKQCDTSKYLISIEKSTIINQISLK